MKSSGLFLAVAVFAAGTASAQSSVTIYGRLDVNYTYQDPATGSSIHKLNDGSVNGVGGSRFGVRGNEDLGAGRKAYFVLESGISVDAGTSSADGFWNRQAYVALGTELGDVRLGRQNTLTRELHLATNDITLESEISIVEPLAPGRTLFQNFGFRANNSVQYISPAFGGFQFRGLVAAGEGTTARQQGGSLLYAGGPFAVGVAYEEYELGNFGRYQKTLTVGARYNLGFMTLSGGFQNVSDLGSNTTGPIGGGGTDQRAYNVGVMVPLGSVELRSQYIAAKVKTGTTSLDQSKFGISARYSFSKRTQLYGAVTRRAGDSNTFARKNEYLVGVGHNF